MRVLAALSGGVDSTVAAKMAIEAGHDVSGVYLSLWGGEANSKSCSTADSEAALSAADELGIPLYVFDLNERFQTEVVDSYVSHVEKGMTPNPCVTCNTVFKIEWLTDFLLEKGDFDKIVTGHYAAIVSDKWLTRGHPDNDQSYFLWQLRRDLMKYFYFPFGNNLNKIQVRSWADRYGLSVADKPASTDLCFNPAAQCTKLAPLEVFGDGIRSTGKVQPGAVTIGQRKGLPFYSIDSQPHYVTHIDSTTVTLGRKGDLITHLQPFSAPAWLDYGYGEVMVQKSSQGPSVRAQVKEGYLEYDSATRRVAPGQSLVFYDVNHNSFVLGGAIAA